MCGIAGLVDPGVTPALRRAAVERMCGAMLHRGPDDAGIAELGSATIGMRRLAIFDPAHGHQPMVSEDGRFHLIFNGAIYNFRALREELAAGGFRFRTACDTEVLLAAYARWGETCLAKLRGMFAFAVWDAYEQTLFLARDPFGIKPLYYRHDGQRFVFASELNALLASGLVAAEIDPQSVADYLAWFSVPAPRTIYRDVFSLQPGEAATFRAGQLERHATWPFSGIAKPAQVCASRAEFLGELRSRLEDTIRAHLAADVPVGAFLSGGLDSAAVVGLMARASGARLRTFSLGFVESDYDESTVAEQTARHLGTDHRTRTLTGAEVAAALPDVLAAFDQPTGDGINTYFVSETARNGGVTVALSGLGGDELFGGYPSFRDLPSLSRWLPWWRAAPRALRRPVVARMRRRGARYRKLADLLEHSRNLHESCALQRRVFSEARRRELLSADTRALLAGQPPHHPQLDALASELRGTPPLETISAWELRTYMADVLLRDSDVMSMRHSLELRMPFVDRPLVEWLWHQPAQFKFDRVQPKSALADALGDVLPPDLAKRPKRGFSLPFATWMRRELRPFLDETFGDTSIARSGLFTASAVQQTWRDFLSNEDRREWSRVWSLAVLIDFVNRRAVAAPSVSAASAPVTIAAPDAGASSRPPRRRRTLLLAPEIFASDGGIPRILRTYLKALCELAEPNDTVRLVALNDSVIDTQDLHRSANDRLTQVRVCSRKKGRFIRDALQLSRGVERIVCGHVAQLPVAFAAKLLNPRLRYYAIAHGIEVWRPFTALERLALRNATRVLCVSDYTRREMLRHVSLREGRAVVLHNGLDPSFEITAGAPFGSEGLVILTVTRLMSSERYKGVEHLIEAMPAVRSQFPTAILRVIGRGDDLPRLHELSRRLGLGTAVEFLGHIDDRRMKQELRNCSLFALASSREGFGLVFLEAMAHGRPCLGVRAGGVPEVIGEDTGILAAPGNTPAIAAACVDALQRRWDQAIILKRANGFSYWRFKEKLSAVLREGNTPAI